MAATVRASRSALGGPEFAPGPHGPLQRLLEVAPMANGVDVIPTTPTVLRDHSVNLGANATPHDGHLIAPNAKPHDTRSQGTASTTNKAATGIQMTTRARRSGGNVHRSIIVSKATASNGPNELASSL